MSEKDTYLLLLVKSGCVFSCGHINILSAEEFLQGSTVDKRHQQKLVIVEMNQVSILVKKMTGQTDIGKIRNETNGTWEKRWKLGAGGEGKTLIYI